MTRKETIMEHTITPGALQDLLDNGAPFTLLDVRRTDDRSKEPAAIPGANWHDPAAIETWSAGLDPGQEIVLYCVRGGSVSHAVVDTLQAKGITARFVEGGLDAWKAAGGATEAQP
jgi:rhodanese-related sulfurtransferase